MASPVVQFQIVAKDPAALSTFYKDLFGWRIDAANALGYRMVDTGAGGTPGGIWPASANGQTFVQLFVSVPDVAAALETARAKGASIIVPETVLPDGDTMAVIADPFGLTVGLMKARA